MNYNNYSRCNDDKDNCACNRCLSSLWLIPLLLFSLLAIVAFIISIIFSHVGLEGAQVQLQTDIVSLENNEPVIFDTVISDNSSNISYDTITGEISITESGTYYINWWFSVGSAPIVTTVDLSIVTSTGEIITASSPILAGQMSGNALLEITASQAVPVTIRLLNTSGGQIFVGPTTVSADLTIVNVDL